MKKFAIISFVFAILGFLTSCLGLGFIFGVLAIIFGIVSRKKGEAGKGFAIAAIIIGAISVIGGFSSGIALLTTGGVFIKNLLSYM